MRKRERGILSVEASIVLTFMTLFVLFLYSFIRVYRAENMVSHATLQAADAMALESYLRENALDDQMDDVVYLANRLTGATALDAENFESLRSANVSTIAKEKFIAAVSNTEANTNIILMNYGVKDGLSGIDFSTSTVDLEHDDVIVNVSYTLKMQFPIFGATELSVTKSAKAKTFGEILFEITAEPEDPNMGSTSGSGNYQHGTTVQITAHPNYGYKFVKWDDGNTDNPRTVPVTDAQKYIAIFEADSFGITTQVSPVGAGTATGAGTYTYLTTANLNATANPGYHFVNWSVYKHKDSTTLLVSDPSVSQTVDQSYTYTAKFKPNTYNISVEYDCQYGTPNVSVTEDNNSTNRGKSIAVQYGNRVILSASQVDGNTFKGWKIKGSNSIFSTNSSVNVPVPIGGATYVAVYEVNLSISLSAGETNKHSMVFTATTTPSNAIVQWKFSGNQDYYTLTVSPDTHKATIVINDAKIDFSSLSVSRSSWDETVDGGTVAHITGTVFSEVTITANIKNQPSVNAKKTVVIEPTAQVFYYMYRKNGTSDYRYYYNGALSHPWNTYTKSVGCFHRIWSVKYSDFVKSKTTASGALFKKISGSDDQHGRNKASIPAHQIHCPKELVGGYGMTVLAYQNGSIKGEIKPGGGYYDYYFSRVK